MSRLIIKNYDAFNKKREIQLFMRKLYRILHLKGVTKFRYLEKDCTGKVNWYFDNSFNILLDKRARKHPHDSYAQTFIHEVLHCVYPDASETWVLTMERRIFKQLTKHQINYIELLLITYM